MQTGEDVRGGGDCDVEIGRLVGSDDGELREREVAEIFDLHLSGDAAAFDNAKRLNRLSAHAEERETILNGSGGCAGVGGTDFVEAGFAGERSEGGGEISVLIGERGDEALGAADVDVDVGEREWDRAAGGGVGDGAAQWDGSAGECGGEVGGDGGVVGGGDVDGCRGKGGVITFERFLDDSGWSRWRR